MRRRARAEVLSQQAAHRCAVAWQAVSEQRELGQRVRMHGQVRGVGRHTTAPCDDTPCVY
jgi:hypothetical protein